MQMRLLFAALLTIFSLGCGDDDAEESDSGAQDAGIDAATSDPTDADVPMMDARVTDGSDEDASDVSDAGPDSGDSGDSGPCLEESYVWSFVECFGEAPGRSARRVTLTEFCADHACPADWTAALAAAAAECDEEGDAGWEACWTATSECGANLLRATHGPNPTLLYYDPATGELRGAADQLTDIYEECVVSEIIAGERPPICCEEPDAG